jgi:hypothetical protein
MRMAMAAKVVGNFHIGSALGTFGLLAGEFSGGTGHSLPPDQWYALVVLFFTLAHRYGRLMAP